MTKREMYTEIRAMVASNEEMVAFIDHEIGLLDKKSKSARKPTKKQIENNGFKAEIVAFLTEVDTPKTISELQASIPSIAELSNQKMTHLLTDLVKSETIIKTYIKKVPYFSVA